MKKTLHSIFAFFGSQRTLHFLLNAMTFLKLVGMLLLGLSLDFPRQVALLVGTVILSAAMHQALERAVSPAAAQIRPFANF